MLHSPLGRCSSRVNPVRTTPPQAGIFNGENMKITKLKSINKVRLRRILMRSYGRNTKVTPIVEKTLSIVKNNGDAAIVEKYQQRYGNTYRLKVNKAEIKRAYGNVSKEFISALMQAKKNITCVCLNEKQSTISKKCTVDSGVVVWREWRPIDRVGLYIPGGKAVYPSSVLMTGIPALVAGCKEIIMCTPPDQNGNVPPSTLVAADIIGIKKIYKVGGAEAIAAMAYGTETVPNVYKIFGAGNSFVTEAKMQVFGIVNIDMPAGPSEVFIIADETAKPEFIAADLLADGEHGYDSGCILITTSGSIIKRTFREIEKQLINLPTKDRVTKSFKQFGLIALAETINEAIDFANEYAPEHLEIMTKNPKEILRKISNAGSVFLGPWTTKSAGDYATGANHVLPTGGMAKMFPPLSVESFGKMMQVQEVSSKKSLRRIRETIETFGETEQLPAHKNATAIRFKKEGEKYEY